MAYGFESTNSPQTNDLGEFRATLSKYGDAAKAARFAVRINGISSFWSKEFALLCESTELPGRAFNVDEARYYGPSFKTPFQSAYADMNFTFICRSEMYEKNFFDDWMELINPKNSYDFQYRKYYSTTVDIFQFAEYGDNNGKLKATYQVTLRQAYPIFVNPLPLNWVEDNIHRLQVTFAYTDWKLPSEADPSSFDIVPGNISSGSVIGSTTRL